MRRLLLLLMPLVFALAAGAQSPAFGEAHASLKKALVGRMLGLAGWCAEKQLYQERDKVWRQVLELDGDNADARKGLRFARNPDGSWKEPAPRPAQNLNKAALAELPARRAETVAPFRDGLLAALAAEPDAARLASAVHGELLRLDPDDAVVRGLRGEVRDGAQWVLGETVRGRARRSELRALVEQALAAPMELLPAAPEANERAWADEWSCGTRAPHVRVLGSGAAGDCEALARKLEATVRLVSALFAVQERVPAEFSFYLAPGAARDAFLERHPAYDAERRAACAKTPGAGIPGGTNTALFESEPRRRDDCAVRNALWQLLRLDFGVDPAHGWAFEGLGLYLGRELVGSRLTWSVLARPDAESLRAGLLAPESNWMSEGLKLLTTAGAPALGSVLDKPVKELAIADMVVGYVFSAYLLEGWPDRAAAFLERTGAGKKTAETSREVLGMSMEELTERLVRWLGERR